MGSSRRAGRPRSPACPGASSSTPSGVSGSHRSSTEPRRSFRKPVLDDAAARRCARSLRIPLIGTLGAILRAKRLGLIASAAEAVVALRAAGLRLDDDTIRISLQRAVGEDWPT